MQVIPDSNAVVAIDRSLESLIAVLPTAVVVGEHLLAVVLVGDQAVDPLDDDLSIDPAVIGQWPGDLLQSGGVVVVALSPRDDPRRRARKGRVREKVADRFLDRQQPIR